MAQHKQLCSQSQLDSLLTAPEDLLSNTPASQWVKVTTCCSQLWQWRWIEKHTFCSISSSIACCFAPKTIKGLPPVQFLSNSAGKPSAQNTCSWLPLLSIHVPLFPGTPPSFSLGATPPRYCQGLGLSPTPSSGLARGSRPGILVCMWFASGQMLWTGLVFNACYHNCRELGLVMLLGE